MANTSSGGTQTCDKPANISLSTKIRTYLLKLRDIENAKNIESVETHKTNDENTENTRFHEK